MYRLRLLRLLRLLLLGRMSVSNLRHVDGFHELRLVTHIIEAYMHMTVINTFLCNSKVSAVTSTSADV